MKAYINGEIMKKIHSITIGAVVGCLLFLSLQGVVYADSIDYTDMFSEYERLITESDSDFIEDTINSFNLEQPLWYPGFLIVQLIKGVLAFIIVLLILFDIIEPS